MIKKANELKAGDVLKSEGIVIEVDLSKDKDGFWGGKPNITILDVNDSYYGPGTRELRENEEFEIITDRKEIVRYYRIIDCDLAKYIADSLEFRKKFREITRAFFTKYNKKEKRKRKDKS